jgi:hypothetical protein
MNGHYDLLIKPANSRSTINAVLFGDIDIHCLREHLLPGSQSHAILTPESNQPTNQPSNQPTNNPNHPSKHYQLSIVKRQLDLPAHCLIKNLTLRRMVVSA